MKKYRIAQVFGFDELDREEKLRRVILVRVILLTVVFGLIWSVLYFVLGLNLGGTVVLTYSVLSLINLAYYYFSRRYDPFRMTQLILILLLPTCTQIALGGFNSASGVVLASILCPLGALMFYNMRVARVLFILYLIMVGIVAGVELLFPDRAVAVDNRIVVSFYAMNTMVISGIVFALLLYFVAQRALFQKMLAEKNKDLTDSIRYAKRIQEAILPPVKFMKTTFPDSFILYKPKDIVAGDFYFFEKQENRIFFAAADCTGHGVPGAMVSVVCANALQRVIKEFNETDPARILDAVRKLVVENFARGDGDEEGMLQYMRDGMDISLCVLNLDTKELHWSGANNGLWLMRHHNMGEIKFSSPFSDDPLRPTHRLSSFLNSERELLAAKKMDPSDEYSHFHLELKPDKQPIGKTDLMRNFNTHKVQLRQGDVIYLFTDGYEDQFGGEKGKKFKAANIKMMLEALCHKPMDQQLLRIDEIFENWRGELEQVDDVCMIGIRI